MIVEPDFADHWKTRMLVDLLEDECAPVYLLRLWAHCQNRRTSTFDNLPPAALKALCRYPGHANKLESSLVSSGYVRRIDEGIEVIKWSEYNASLIANWENGKKGGRPPKNPSKTHGLPMGNPSRTEKRREEKISEYVDTARGPVADFDDDPTPGQIEAWRNIIMATPEEAEAWITSRRATAWMVNGTKRRPGSDDMKSFVLSYRQNQADRQARQSKPGYTPRGVIAAVKPGEEYTL